MIEERAKIFSELLGYGFTPYMVGGYPRDCLLGVNSKDMDVEVFGCSIEQLESVLSQFGKVSTVGKRFGIIKLTTEYGEYDFSVPRRDNLVGIGRGGFEVEFDLSLTPTEASKRRDFTFNAMFMGIDGEIIDPHNGMEDLRLKRLRHTSSAFIEDPTRVLRGMRFCGQLDLRPYRRTTELCKLMFERYSEIEDDMIWAEWEKWAKRSVKPSRGLSFLWVTRWIHHYPELYNMTRVPQEPEWHPEGSVWQHTKHVVDEMVNLCDRDMVYGDERVIRVFGALLHDCGKPATTTINEEGRIASPAHDEVGVDIALSFMERIHAPKRFHQPVADMVRYHMRHIHHVTPRTARRLSAKLTEITKNDWLAIVEADHSGRPPLPKGIPEAAQTMYDLMTTEEQDNKVKPLVLGRHLIVAGFQPSPNFGTVLSYVYELQLDEGYDFDTLYEIATSEMNKLF